MKKLLTIILFVAYCFASSGATFHFHYCGGKLIEWDLGKSNSEGKCRGCGMAEKDKKDGCCTDKTTTINISGKYQHSVSDFQIVTPQSILSIFLKNEDFEAAYFTLSSDDNYLKLYLRQTPLIYVFKCVLLI